MLKITSKEAIEYSKNPELVNYKRQLMSSIYFPVNKIDDQFICYSYLALVAKKYLNENFNNLYLEELLKDIEDRRIADYIYSVIDRKTFERNIHVFVDLDDAILLGFIFSNEFEEKYFAVTPQSISELGLKALDINKDEGKKYIADICCGVGGYLVKTASLNQNSEFYGCDINPGVVGIALIRSSLLQEKIEVELKDAFDLIADERKFDYIFMNHPFGMRLHQLKDRHLFDYEFVAKAGEISQSTSCDWLFALLGLEKLSNNGRMAMVVANSCLYNGLDSKIREYFVKNNYISAIIELPSNMFSETSISTSLIIFDKNNDGTIRFVNATKKFQKGRRKNFFSEIDIFEIINQLGMDSNISISLNINEINKDGYQLNPLRYIKVEDTEFENGVEFESVIKDVFRGAPLKASELDEIASNYETEYQYMMLSNIKDGVVDKELPYITNIEDKYLKYCIKDKSFLVSKNGAPFKTAIAEVEEGRKILANGNLYVFELDEEKVNPYYVQAFFASDAGQKLLSKFVVGTAIPNLPLQDFKKAIIPLPDLETQNSIAEEYAAAMDEINVLKIKLERAKKKLKESFNKGKGE